MTSTCQPCNSDLGSKVERELENWFDHALTEVAFDNEDVLPGKRHAPTIYFRKATDSNKVLLLIDGNLTPDVQEMIRPGNLNMHWRMPDPRRYRMALLKHAYLAACLSIKGVPDSPEANAIRAALVAVRDAPKRSRPPDCAAADRLKVYRSDAGVQGPPLALVARQEDPDAEPEVLISLAGVLFVSWPFTDIPPGVWRAVEDDLA